MSDKPLDDRSRNYFFNKYDLTVVPQEGEAVKQTFHINPSQKVNNGVDEKPELVNTNITLKEAYNLLSGRAVNKDMVNQKGEKYNTWLKLDFTEKLPTSGNFKMEYYNGNFFDIDKAMAKLKFAEGEDVAKITESLKKGNRQAVTLEHNGNNYSRFLEANPKFKMLNVYDGNKKVAQESSKEQTEGKSKSQGQKQDASQDASEGPTHRNRRNKKQGQGDEGSDPPKKRTRKSQGIS